jgi:hypothetical protein
MKFGNSGQELHSIFVVHFYNNFHSIIIIFVLELVLLNTPNTLNTM